MNTDLLSPEEQHAITFARRITATLTCDAPCCRGTQRKFSGISLEELLANAEEAGWVLLENACLCEECGEVHNKKNAEDSYWDRELKQLREAV